jgi:hypothetical protein
MFVCNVADVELDRRQDWTRMRLRLGIAALVLGLLSTAALAQEAGGEFAGQVPVSCTLKKPLSSRNAKAGQDIMAVTEHPAKVNGTEIPRGSLLTGHVVDVTPKKGGQSGSLTIVFDKLEPKKGTAFAVETSVYRIALSENQIEEQRNVASMGTQESTAAQQASAAVHGDMGQMNDSVAPDGTVTVASAIPGVALSAVTGGEKSGVVTAQSGDVELAGGTRMVVGVKSK